MSLGSDGGFRLLLDEADFATASRVASAINEHFGGPVARAEDPVGIRIRPPEALQDDPVAMMAAVQAVEVRPDRAAKVVINERTGTVVLGGDVRVSSVALAHGNLQIEIATIREASQPAPLSETGRTVVVPNSELYVSEGPNRILALDEGVTVTDVVESLNAIGVSARDMIAIFQAMRAAGALHAELVIL